MTAQPPQPPAGMTKAHAGAMTVLVAGFTSHIVIKWATQGHAWWLDDYTTEAIPDMVTAGFTWLSVYLPSNG